VRTRDVAECMNKAKELKKSTKKVAGIDNSKNFSKSGNTSVPSFNSPAAKNNSSPKSGRKSPTPAEKKVEETPVVVELGPWNDDDQKKFEAAMRIVPRDHPTRWDEIARLVGRPRKDCVQRFKEIKAMLAAGK
jgi:hypothetical protein